MSKKYEARLCEIAQMAEQTRAFAVSPQFKDGQYISDEKERTGRIVSAMKEEPLFENLNEEAKSLIGTAWGSAIEDYVNARGVMPRDEILASAFSGLKNMLEGTESSMDQTSKVMLESAGDALSSSNGVIVRDNLAALILPVMLQQATSACCTFIPAGREQADIFRIHTMTASKFGEYDKNVILDASAVGQYMQMRQRFDFKSQPNGTEKTFTMTPETDLKVGRAMAIRPNRTRIYADGVQIGADSTEGSTAIYGSFGDIAIDNTESSVNLTTGVVTVTFNEALAEGVVLTVEVEVDIESDPTLIPTVTSKMEQKTLRPSQYAVATDSTAMAQWSMKREFGIDTQASNLTQMRNKMASEKDRKVLRDIRFHCVENSDFDCAVPAGLERSKHLKTLSGHLAKRSQLMMTRTGVSGIVGAYIGPDGYQFCADLEGDGFEFAPNYQIQDTVHYVGRLFGQYDIYFDPFAPEELTNVFHMFGRGKSHSQAGYVVGDAVPPILFKHGITNGLVNRDTLWGYGYSEIHPYNGADFFEAITLKNI